MNEQGWHDPEVWSVQHRGGHQVLIDLPDPLVDESEFALAYTTCSCGNQIIGTAGGHYVSTITGILHTATRCGPLTTTNTADMTVALANVPDMTVPLPATDGMFTCCCGNPTRPGDHRTNGGCGPCLCGHPDRAGTHYTNRPCLALPDTRTNPYPIR